MTDTDSTVATGDVHMNIDTSADTPVANDQVLEELIHKADDTQLSDPNEPKIKSSFPLLKVIGWDLIWIAIGMFFAGGSGIIPLVFFWVMGNSFGDMATASAAEIANVTATMGLNVTYIAIAAGFSALLSNLFFGIGSQRVANKIRQAYFNQVTRQEIGFFDIKKAGALAHTLSDDATKAADVFSTHLQTITQNVVQVLVGLGMALASNWTMALLQLTGVPLMFLVQIPIRPMLSTLATRISKTTAISVSTANEVITSMRTVRSMAGEEKEVARYSKELDKVGVYGLIQAIVRGVSIMLLFFFIFGAVALAFWYGGIMLKDGRIEIGAFIKVYGLSLMTVIGMLFTLILIPEVIKAQSSAKQMLLVILRKPTMEFRGGVTLPEIRGHIQFQDVTFRYPSRPKVAVLKNFSLDIQPGTSVALVGQSGSGKSTIVGLIEKWYEPNSGKVLLDGVDITTIDPLWLHRYLGIVSQEPTLFATTIRRNIAYAVDTINGHIMTAEKKKNPKITQEELDRLLIPITQELIEKAAKDANAHDFIVKLPDGYDTVIGERGVSLSGGQKQRIAIARAVLQDPKMLLLDEATSALDTKSEALVQDALEKLMVGRTSIVIAHRLTTIQDCDNIVVMRQGLVVEMGRHDTMIQNPEGAYYALAAKQMKLGKSDSSSNLSDSDSQSDESTQSEDIKEQAETRVEELNTDQALSVINSSSSIIQSQQPSVQEAVEVKEVQGGRKKSKRSKKKKSVQDFTNEEDVKDIHEPVVRNPFLVLKLCGIDGFLLMIGLIGAFLSGTVPIFNYLFFGNIVSSYTPARNSDGSFIPYPPGYDISEKVAVQASYIAIVAGCGAIAQFFNWFFTTLVYERLAIRIRRKYFTALTKQEMGFFDIKKSGKLLSTLGEEVTSISDGFTLKGALFAQHMGQFIIGITLALIASWQTALVMLAGGVPSIGAIIFFSAMAINYFNKKIMHLSGSALASANEVIGAIRTVRSMAGEEREQRRYGNDLNKILSAGIGKAIATAIMMGGMQFCIWGVAGLAFWYGGTLIANGTLPAGSLLQVFGNMLFAVLGASMALSEVQNFFKSMTASYEVMRVTERKPTIPCKGGVKPEKLDGQVEFKNITFEYPSRPGLTVMKNFNLVINKGQHVALVGESGCGKSTVTGLIERFYEPKEGQVLLDGRDLKEIDVQWLHRNVAIVTQEPVLFATTIRKNITYAVGDENVTMDRVIECAKAANCHDFITNLPNGYDTMIGERGVSMSGGQKQRIAIARAMIQDASVLLLDEATSALDTEAEALVQGALDKLMVGKTTIVIAHRLSTVRDCDLIVAMRAGEVIEMGNHDQLIQKKGMYFKLAQKQMEFGQDKGAKTHVVMSEDD